MAPPVSSRGVRSIPPPYAGCSPTSLGGLLVSLVKYRNPADCVHFRSVNTSCHVKRSPLFFTYTGVPRVTLARFSASAEMADRILVLGTWTYLTRQSRPMQVPLPYTISQSASLCMQQASPDPSPHFLRRSPLAFVLGQPGTHSPPSQVSPSPQQVFPHSVVPSLQPQHRSVQSRARCVQRSLCVLIALLKLV